MKNPFFFSLIYFFVSYCYGQTDKTHITPDNLKTLQAYEDTLVVFGDSIVQSKDWQMREIASVQSVKYLVKALKTPYSYEYPFDSIGTMSIMQSPDKKFRIFTWQLTLKDRTYRYYGAIQMNEPDLKLFPLIDMSLFIKNPEDTILNSNNWYGGIYYNVVKEKYRKENYYVIFSWDGNDMFSNKKMVDILSFDKTGNPIFGKPVFQTSDNVKPKSRIIIEYKEDASPYLNYDDNEKMIVFDNLQPEDPRAEGIYMTYVPDGTYQGFKFDKGIWKLQKIVFTQTQDQAPDYTPKHRGEDPGAYIKK